MKYKNLIIVGTSHIAKQSVREVEEAIVKEKPAFVALELDKDRLMALIRGERSNVTIRHIFRVGLGGYLLLKLGRYIEEKLGRSIGSQLGGEMLKSLEIANKQGCKIALVDQDVRITLKKFSKAFNWRVKFKLVWDLLKGLVKREKMSFDLNKVPDKDFIVVILGQFKDRYPGIYNALVHDRNIYMAKKLTKLMTMGKTLAVVGAGHEEGLIEEIKKIEKNKKKAE